MPRRSTSLRHHRRLWSAWLVLMLVFAGFVGIRAPAAHAQDPGDGVSTITGSLVVTNPFVLEIISEPYVLLSDLSNFVKRDIDGDLPSFLQITGQLEGDLATATYTLPLPIAPQATTDDVDNGEPGDGVQIYSIDLSANFVGDPFVQPIEGGSWATSFTSVDTAIGTNEITGGRIVVWSPDDEQSFPSGFGDDGKLFTDDDPIESIPQGWTVVDLDQSPFEQVRDNSVDVAIKEGDGGLKDLSELSYTEAFDALVDELRLRYPFTDYKHIDWDDIVSQIRPRIEEAEQENDAQAFQVAMMRFTVLIGDGHVSVDPNVDYLIAQYGGGFGLSLGQTDDGEIVVAAVADGSSAADAGIKLGDEITSWDGKPAGEALADTNLIFSSSSPHTTTLQQLALLARDETGAEVEVGYTTIDGDEETDRLEAQDDLEGLVAALGGPTFNPAEMPVTVKILDSGLGYIRVNTFADDAILMTHAWDWAIAQLNELGVAGLIVDVRGNSGGSGFLATYMAGSFYDDEFPLSEAYFADEDGQFVYNGTATVMPNGVEFEGQVAILIDQNCASACEDFSAAMAHDADHIIVGQYPSAGVMAGIYPWQLPDDLYFQAPLVYYEDGGNVWLEGQGVQPTVDVPVTVASLTSDDDVVLDAAVAALLDA